MNFARYFVDRPIFAAVLSLLILVAGLIALPNLPISEYPNVVPPSIAVRAVYPGGDPKTISETVAAPIEEAVNGVENMIYMKSVAGSDGVMNLQVSFKQGTDVDLAQVQVQNRVAQALPRLPESVRLLGVSTTKQAATLTMVVHLTSPDGRYDALYLRNYATLRVKDELARIPGVGQAVLFGAGDYAMRVWIDPEKAAARDLTAGDIVRAIREQNVQVSAGSIGGPPQPNATDFTLSINAPGRLVTEQEFSDVVLKTTASGELVRLADVARLELGASEYALRSLLNNKQAVAIPIFEAPGANSIALSSAVRKKMRELEKSFPPGVSWDVVYDPTVFVRDSIKEVVKTLLEAVALVVLVVILFLQTWRASIIPLIAVPVSVIGTFAVLWVLGFSINVLTLFGLVLAIGIVVDDAIVVVENVERNIAEGLTPRAAAHKAMSEVSSPIIAIALVLCAVFVPISFLSGVTGEFYRQFAVTIAISTIISAFNSLTLSPALCAMLLKPHGAPKDLPARLIERGFGWLFRPFNRFFTSSSEAYARGVKGVISQTALMLLLYGGLIGLTVLGFRAVPGGFIPIQDKLYLFAVAFLPEGASLERTESVIRKMGTIAAETKGVATSVQFPGLNAVQFSNTPSMGTIFFGLDDFEKRQGRTASEIVAELNQRFSSEIKEGMAFALLPPPVLGLGNSSGYEMYIQDRAGLGFAELNQAKNALTMALMQVSVNERPAFEYPISSYQSNVPQLSAEVDRIKAKQQGINLGDLYTTLQVYLGSAYVNDFNLFGRTYQVYAQADASFRDDVSDIAGLKTRNQSGEMVPLGSVVQVKNTYGPDPVVRYNGYPAADLSGAAKAGVSSVQAVALAGAAARSQLPNGISFEWTGLTYEQVTQGNAAVLIFPLCVLLVWMVLAALYESWTLPLSVILIVPMCMLAAIIGVWLTGGDNNIFTQIGLLVLMGLACKNAILIVEFARELEMQGMETVRAALESCRLRLRPILMTSLAFIMGVIPLVIATGAGSEIRRTMGITVFSGMLGVTFFGLFLTPVFYVFIRKFVQGGKPIPIAGSGGDLIARGSAHA